MFLLRSVVYLVYSKMAAGARHEANLMNFVQESAEKDEIKPEKYVILLDCQITINQCLK